MLSWALLDVKIGSNYQVGIASTISNIGATKVAIKVISKGWVVIRALTKTPFGTDIGATIKAITGVVRYKSRDSIKRKKENIIRGIRKSTSKTSKIYFFEFTL